MLWSYEDQTVIWQNKFHLLCCQYKTNKACFEAAKKICILLLASYKYSVLMKIKLAYDIKRSKGTREKTNKQVPN